MRFPRHYRWGAGVAALCIVLALVVTGSLIVVRVLRLPGQEHEAGVKQGESSPSEAAPTTEAQLYVVERVIDGDTLSLDNGWTVRLIGVDTPETNHPELPVQRFGEEATAFTRRMVEGLRVTLEPAEPDEDTYGRKLAYVFVDGTLLVTQGMTLLKLTRVTKDEIISAGKQQ